ncbi:conserved hypothetical protein [Altererythrobacter sp. B11]|uniref:DUF1674 domain-containing protein n=1 Tax=Altererythrobacter sp. B11 TaxID=2060312 RepID=UPI000DC6ECEB|nr:DUF1674 domain-containing protein [Altererythrobacter sp. B11]BBC71918.1 conserved hypothetical protein [Altererythrobacter sp. B11]
MIASGRQSPHVHYMTERPKTFHKPAYWSDSPPPQPGPPKQAEGEGEELSPTRYGDWVKNGIAIDF